MMKFLCVLFAVLLLTSPEVQGDVAWMRKALENNFSKSRHFIYPVNKTITKTFIKSEFTAMGLDVQLHTYNFIQNNFAGIHTAENIIGILKGQYFNTSKDTLIAIGAHYDTMDTTPGVDDNGAGVVVMLAAARQLASQGQGRRNSTVLFIAFDMEEYYEGSLRLALDWMPTLAGWKDGWKGIYVMDTVFNYDDTIGSQNFPEEFKQLFPEASGRIAADGKRGNFIAAIGRTDPQDVELLARFNQSWVKQPNNSYKVAVLNIPTAYLNQPAANHLTRSDHRNFWLVGKAAVFLTDTADFRGYMKECYHKACDSASHITDANLLFASKLSSTLVDTINTYAPVTATSGSGRHDSTFVRATSLLSLNVLISLLVRTSWRS